MGEEKDVIGVVKSRFNYPVELEYNNEGVMLPPRGKFVEINKSKLGPLPEGVSFIENINQH